MRAKDSEGGRGPPDEVLARRAFRCISAGQLPGQLRLEAATSVPDGTSPFVDLTLPDNNPGQAGLGTGVCMLFVSAPRCRPEACNPSMRSSGRLLACPVQQRHVPQSPHSTRRSNSAAPAHQRPPALVATRLPLPPAGGAGTLALAAPATALPPPSQLSKRGTAASLHQGSAPAASASSSSTAASNGSAE